MVKMMTGLQNKLIFLMLQAMVQILPSFHLISRLEAHHKTDKKHQLTTNDIKMLKKLVGSIQVSFIHNRCSKISRHNGNAINLG
jgi:hypothetical protein